MHSDDEPVGHLLSRRHALTLLGTAGVALVAGPGVAMAATDPTTSSLDCVAKPEATEGPYFVDEGLNRSDIRTDPANGSVSKGTTLTLTLRVLQIKAGKCTPLKDAVVDLWQCDATGLYSDEASEGSLGRKFLRGYQVSDRAGNVRFVTILPGWYAGRTIHFHVKIRTTGTDGKPYEFTSQLYFTEEFKATYLAADPYVGKGTPDTTNAADRFYVTGGDQMLLRPKPARHGYAADFAIGLDLSDTAVGAPDRFPGFPGQQPPAA
jgi:protocatechuate 3,4-dioxygenase beta subunit